LTDFLDAFLDSTLVVLTSLNQDALDALFTCNWNRLVSTLYRALEYTHLDVFVGHIVERLSKVLQEKTKKGSRTEQDQGFFVQNIDFLGD
jgi:hypothetical protein